MPYPYQNFPYQYNQPLDQLEQLRAQQYQPPMMPPMQPQYQPVGINGKFVQNVDGITANDVPMDGSAAIFPTQDLREIYAKSWNADGTIKTVIYRPVTEQANTSAQVTENAKFDLSDASTGEIMERFDDVIERISRLEKSIKTPARKKGDSADE